MKRNRSGGVLETGNPVWNWTELEEGSLAWVLEGFVKGCGARFCRPLGV